MPMAGGGGSCGCGCGNGFGCCCGGGGHVGAILVQSWAMLGPDCGRVRVFFLSSEMQSKRRLYELHVSSVRVNHQIPWKNNLIPFVVVHCYWGERSPDRSGIIPVCEGRSKIYVNHGLSARGVHWMGNFLGGGMLISSKLLRTVKSF